MVKAPKKKEKKAQNDVGMPDQPPPAVNKVQQGGSNQSNDGANGNVVTCEHCSRTGHTKANCYQLQKCDYCERTGHTVTYCREFIEKMAAARARVKTGDMTGDELVNQLNK